MTLTGTLPERIHARISEVSSYGASTWVHDTLRTIFDLHPQEGEHCLTCLAPAAPDGDAGRHERYPCPTVREVMDTVAFPAWERAHEAVWALVEASVAEGGLRPLTVLRRPEADHAELFAFEAIHPARGVLLRLPGLDLDRLRPATGGSIRGLAHVKIDDGSWVWPIAVDILVRISRRDDTPSRDPHTPRAEIDRALAGSGE